MAVSAKFLADFSSFQTAVAGTEAKLRSFETTTSGVQKGLDRLGNSFSGQKILSEATLAVKAVTDIGGASKLTDAEQARLNSTLTEAIAKYQALGQTAPKAMLDLEAATRQSGDASEAAAEQTEGLGARITGLVAAGAAAVAATRELIAIGVDWVSASNAQEDASVRLSTALRAQGTFTPELAAQYDQLASAFEQTTINSDEMLQEMEALLVTVGGVMPKDMKAALTASTDLAAGLRIDLGSATELVAKALEGNIGALKRHGIVIDETAFKTRGAVVVFEAIADKMGGQATEQAKTFSGQMARLGNVIDNVKEMMGGFIASVLQPAIDLFMKLPEPVRTGVVVLGLLGTAAVALSGAVAGIAAALALALPLLGMGTAVAGAAAIGGLEVAAGSGAVALGGLGAAAGTAAAVMGSLGIAIGLVWAAWKIGNIESVKNSIAEWALSADNLTAKLFRVIAGVDQMTPANAKAAVGATAAAVAAAALAVSLGTVGAAAEAAGAPLPSYAAQLAAITEQVGHMSAAQKEEVLAAKALGMNEDELLKKFGLSHAALTLLTEGHQAHAAAVKKAGDETAAAAKKMAEAWTEVRAAGLTWQDTLAGINGETLTSVRAGLEAGVSQSALATAYHLTAVEVKAVSSFMTEQLEVQKKTDQAIAETTKLWNEYDAIIATQGVTALDAQIAAIDRWAADVDAQLKKAYGDTENYYMATAALAAVEAEKKKSLLVDWEAINKEITTNTQAGLQQIADKAQSTFDYVLAHADQFSTGTIDKFWATAIEAQKAADNWGQSFAGAADAITVSATKAADAVTMTWGEAMSAVSSGLGTMTGTVQAAMTQSQMQKAASEAGGSVAYDDYNNPYIHVAGVNAAGKPVPGQASIPGFAGGVKNFAGGMALVGERGPEIVTLPRGSSVIPHGGRMPEHRAMGGPANAGQSYIVGEQKPELFTPGASGFITPSVGGGLSSASGSAGQMSDSFSAVTALWDKTVIAAQKAADAWGQSFEGARKAIVAGAATAAASVSATWGDAIAAVSSGPITMAGMQPALPSGGGWGGPTGTHDMAKASPRLYTPDTKGGLVKNGGDGRTVNITVHVDASESFYDTPAGVQRLADKVGEAVKMRLGLA